MCDFSLSAVKSRPAVVGDKLVTKNFGTGTTGFAAPEASDTAVCLLPGTELAFNAPVSIFYDVADRKRWDTAIFRQINKETERTHHDCVEFPDGQRLLLNALTLGQLATVLQLPAVPKTPEEAKDQERVAYAG